MDNLNFNQYQPEDQTNCKNDAKQDPNTIGIDFFFHVLSFQPDRTHTVLQTAAAKTDTGVIPSTVRHTFL